MSIDDHRIASNAVQATASVPTEAVVVAQPGKISSGIASSAAGIARLAEVVRVTDYWGEPFAPPQWRRELSESEDVRPRADELIPG